MAVPCLLSTTGLSWLPSTIAMGLVPVCNYPKVTCGTNGPHLTLMIPNFARHRWLLCLLNTSSCYPMLPDVAELTFALPMPKCGYVGSFEHHLGVETVYIQSCGAKCDPNRFSCMCYSPEANISHHVLGKMSKWGGRGRVVPTTK